MSEEPANPLDEIWQGDLFGRQEEALLLIGYIESIGARQILREDARAHTIAVDSGYGMGKSFFLSRLARQLKLNHPVAFVDAWADDLADEPLVALTATIKAALEPLLGEKAIQSKLTKFMAKTGTVAKIAATGLFKRGLGLLITGGSVDLLSDVLGKAADEVKEAVNEGLTDGGQSLVDEIQNGLAAASSRMEERVAEFQAGKAATASMKASLTEIVQALENTSRQAPIVIIVDELDRCRPTYAIKLLEEIKHLFDVPGLVFIFGLHGDQLSHSVAGAYGTGFDGKGYLRRFFSRHYALADPDLLPLVKAILRSYDIPEQRIEFPDVVRENRDEGPPVLAELVSEYMSCMGLRPRDAFEVVDILQTCLALTGKDRLVGGYLLPLVMGHVKGMEKNEWPRPITRPKLKFRYFENRRLSELSLGDLAEHYNTSVKLTTRELTDYMNMEYTPFWINDVFTMSKAHRRMGSDYSELRNYPKLLTMVSRFKAGSQ